MKRTYTDLTLSLGLMPCRHCDRDVLGAAEFPTIHFLDLPVNRASNRRYLKLAAIALDDALTDGSEPLWRSIYRTSVAMRDVARQVHVRYPRGDDERLSKAVVLAGVAGLSNEVPLRKKAFDWARR